MTQAQGPRYFPTINLIVRVDGDPLDTRRPSSESFVRSIPTNQSA